MSNRNVQSMAHEFHSPDRTQHRTDGGSIFLRRRTPVLGRYTRKYDIEIGIMLLTLASRLGCPRSIECGTMHLLS